MKKLSDVLKTLGYGHRDELALIQLAAFSGCFNKKIENEISFTGTIISKEKANELSKLTFDSLQVGLKWWVDVTQAAWYRRNQYSRAVEFKKNSIESKFESQSLEKFKAKGAERTAADMNRWIIKSFNEISQYVKALKATQEDRKPDVDVKKENPSRHVLEQDEVEMRKELQTICDALHLIKPIECNDFANIHHIVIHGSKDHIVRRTIKGIDKDRFRGKIYYLTNERFLFIDEKSVPFIIAKWFGKSKRKERRILRCIQATLCKERKKRSEDQRDCIKDLPGLRQTIIDDLRQKKLITDKEGWPLNHGYYYQAKDRYEANMKREKVTYSAAGWPTASDMCEYWLRQHFKEKIAYIQFCPVYPNRLKCQRIANTEDIVRDWYQSHCKDWSKGARILFLSTNRNMHYIRYQHKITKHVLKQEKAYLKIKTIGPGVSTQEGKGFCFTNAVDALSKTMHYWFLNSQLSFFKPVNSVASQERKEELKDVIKNNENIPVIKSP